MTKTGYVALIMKSWDVIEVGGAPLSPPIKNSPGFLVVFSSKAAALEFAEGKDDFVREITWEENE